VARKASQVDYPGNVILVTHDRYFLDNVVNWILELDRGKYFPYEGNYSTYLEKKAKRLEQEEREEAAARRRSRTSSSGSGRAPKARQTKSKARIKASSTSSSRRRKSAASGKAEILIQTPSGSAARSSRSKGNDQGLWRQIAVRESVVQPAAGRDRRRDRPQRRRQVDPVQADHRPGNARRGDIDIGDDGPPRLCRPEPRRLDPKKCVGGDLRTGSS
jgi:ATPase subunit of ABC transporter with duplicated ATPase domains